MPPSHKTADKIIIVPKQQHLSDEEDLRILVTRHKILRLTGLQTDPEAFTSTYERELDLSGEVWTNRVLNPLGRIFVTLFPESDSSDLGIRYVGGATGDVRRLLLYPWLGQFTLLGPVIYPRTNEAENTPWELFKDIDYHQAARDATSIRAGERVVYVIVGMYVLPEGRRAGNGQRLLQAAVNAVDEERRRMGRAATISVLVARENPTAKRLYERVGFVAKSETVDIEGEPHWPLTLDVGN
ncbi:hypothetical protein BDV19DRAFT_371394 [Aspergillus venezuelensis]